MVFVNHPVNTQPCERRVSAMLRVSSTPPCAPPTKTLVPIERGDAETAFLDADRRRLIDGAGTYMNHEFAWTLAEFPDARRRLVGSMCRILYFHAYLCPTAAPPPVYCDDGGSRAFRRAFDEACACMARPVAGTAGKAACTLAFFPPDGSEASPVAKSGGGGGGRGGRGGSGGSGGGNSGGGDSGGGDNGGSSRGIGGASTATVVGGATTGGDDDDDDDDDGNDDDDDADDDIAKAGDPLPVAGSGAPDASSPATVSSSSYVSNPFEPSLAHIERIEAELGSAAAARPVRPVRPASSPPTPPTPPTPPMYFCLCGDAEVIAVGRDESARQEHGLASLRITMSLGAMFAKHNFIAGFSIHCEFARYGEEAADQGGEARTLELPDRVVELPAVPNKKQLGNLCGGDRVMVDSERWQMYLPAEGPAGRVGRVGGLREGGEGGEGGGNDGGRDGGDVEAVDYRDDEAFWEKFRLEQTCAACGTWDPPSRCQRCQAARYCNATCQKLHWKQHKRTCTPVGGGKSSKPVKGAVRVVGGKGNP